MSKDWAALQRLVARRFRADTERGRTKEARTPLKPGRAEIRVRYFPSTENRGRATRGAEPIAGQVGLHPGAV